MRSSDHFNLNLVEGTDIVNPLVQDVPNYEAIDEQMYDNMVASVGVATELRTGTVHALTRQTTDAPVFRFTATSKFTVGDTFTVDGVQVSALLVDGSTLPDEAYVIGSEVLCTLKGTLLTVYANRTTASDSDKLGGELPAYYAKQSDLDTAEGVIDSHTNQINTINSDITDLNKSATLLHSGVFDTGLLYNINALAYRSIVIKCINRNIINFIEIPTCVLADEPEVYWLTSYYHTPNLNVAVAFSVSKTQIGLDFIQENGSVASSTGAYIYGVK